MARELKGLGDALVDGRRGERERLRGVGAVLGHEEQAPHARRAAQRRELLEEGAGALGEDEGRLGRLGLVLGVRVHGGECARRWSEHVASAARDLAPLTATSLSTTRSEPIALAASSPSTSRLPWRR